MSNLLRPSHRSLVQGGSPSSDRPTMLGRNPTIRNSHPRGFPLPVHMALLVGHPRLVLPRPGTEELLIETARKQGRASANLPWWILGSENIHLAGVILRSKGPGLHLTSGKA